MINEIKVERDGKEAKAFIVCANFEKNSVEIQAKGKISETSWLFVLLVKSLSRDIPKHIINAVVEMALKDAFNPTMIDINALNEQLKK